MSTNNSIRPKLLILVGPTASGKTELAIYLARTLNGEIISADSRYLFKELNIGTAKPAEKELSNVQHHLINVTDLLHPWSLGIYKRNAIDLIFKITNRNKIPLLVGGTGQYIRSITENWEIPSQSPENVLRTAIENWGNKIGFENLHEKLMIIDPAAAEIIDYRNVRRTVRALEVIFLSGKRFSEQRSKSEAVFDSITIGIDWPRPILYQRIDERIQSMINAGFIEEVRKLRQEGLSEQLVRIGVIGYSEILDYINGVITLEDAITKIKRNTRVFVRRQANWFKKNDPSIHWFNAEDPDMKAHILDLLSDFLSY